jgi:hypothetical protein
MYYSNVSKKKLPQRGSFFFVLLLMIFLLKIKNLLIHSVKMIKESAHLFFYLTHSLFTR